MNKTQKVLEYMKEHKNTGITQLEAIQLCWATRLSSIIYNLKKDYQIETVTIYDKDAYGDSTHYSRYFYKGERNGE